MSADQLELRLTAIETAISQVREKVERITTDPKRRWWELQSSFPPAVVGEMLDEIDPYTKYIRQTGDVPPPDWKPGDPIPEPDHWK